MQKWTIHTIFITQRVKVREKCPETLNEYVCSPFYEKQQSMRKWSFFNVGIGKALKGGIET